MPLIPEHEKFIEAKCALDRAVDALNAVNELHGAVAVWDTCETLLITLRERRNPNPHLAALQKFLFDEWPTN